jgi:hypothetical protein
MKKITVTVNGPYLVEKSDGSLAGAERLFSDSSMGWARGDAATALAGTQACRRGEPLTLNRVSPSRGAQPLKLNRAFLSWRSQSLKLNRTSPSRGDEGLKRIDASHRRGTRVPPLERRRIPVGGWSHERQGRIALAGAAFACAQSRPLCR